MLRQNFDFDGNPEYGTDTYISGGVRVYCKDCEALLGDVDGFGLFDLFGKAITVESNLSHLRGR